MTTDLCLSETDGFWGRMSAYFWVRISVPEPGRRAAEEERRVQEGVDGVNVVRRILKLMRFLVMEGILWDQREASCSSPGKKWQGRGQG